MKGSLAAQRAKEKFTVQVDELELEAERAEADRARAEADRARAEVDRKLQEAQAEVERKQLQIRLKRLREGGERAGMEAEFSVLEEEEVGGDRSLLDTDNPFVGVSTLNPTGAPSLQLPDVPRPDLLTDNNINGQVGDGNELSSMESRQREGVWNQNTSPPGGNPFPPATTSENTGGWSFPATGYPPLYRIGFNENIGLGGRPVVENSTQEGGGTTPSNSLSVQPAKSVGFMLPGNSVSQPGSGREGVDRILDGIISGNLHPGRTQTIAAGAPLYTGTIPRNQPTQSLPPSMHPGRSSSLPERNNGNMPPVTTMTGVINTTTTTTQSRGTVPGLGSSWSPVVTTSSHGASPGERPPLSSNPVPSATSSSPMVTTCSATSHSSTTQTYVSSPSIGSVPVPSPNTADVLTPQPQVVTILDGLIDVVKGIATKRESSLCQDVSHHSELSDHNLAANRQLAWAQIKADTRAERFDGRDTAFYQSWRKALEAEVQQLSPPPESWIQIIDLRTTGEAKEMVKTVKKMAIENPQEALDLIWENFECRYKSNPQAASKCGTCQKNMYEERWKLYLEDRKL